MNTIFCFNFYCYIKNTIQLKMVLKLRKKKSVGKYKVKFVFFNLVTRIKFNRMYIYVVPPWVDSFQN